MLKGRILGIFCRICLFSECFLSIRDVVWLWALLVERLWTLLVEGCGLCLQEGCGLCLWEGCGLACRKVVGFVLLKAVGFCLQKGCGLCLFLSLFLRDLVCWRVNIVCSKRESSLLGQRKQLPGIDYNYCLDRWSKDLLI